MGHRVKVRFGEEWVDGEELQFEPLKESWNEYRCSDGSYVKLKVVVSKITRLERQNPQGGAHLFNLILQRRCCNSAPAGGHTLGWPWN